MPVIFGDLERRVGDLQRKAKKGRVLLRKPKLVPPRFRAVCSRQHRPHGFRSDEQSRVKKLQHMAATDTLLLVLALADVCSLTRAIIVVVCSSIQRSVETVDRHFM